VQRFNHSVEKDFGRSLDGGFIKSDEDNMDDFPIERFDFLNNE